MRVAGVQWERERAYAGLHQPRCTARHECGSIGCDSSNGVE